MIQGDAASLTTLAGTTLVATQAGEAFTLGEAATAGARVLVTLARLASMPATVLLALFTPTNATEQFVDLGNGERFRTRPGELYGELQQQTLDGRWLSVPGQIRLDQLQGRSMLSDEERDRVGAPLTNPADPRPSPPLITPVPADRDRARPLPGFEGQAPIGPTTTTTPMESPSWTDLITESRDSRELADNLITAGDVKPGSGYQPHHIVPLNDPRAASLQRLLRDAGIDPNSASNGVWLPANDQVPNSGETLHNETMRDSYFAYLSRTFAGATGRADMESKLTQIRDYLRSGQGDFPKKP